MYLNNTNGTEKSNGSVFCWFNLRLSSKREKKGDFYLLLLFIFLNFHFKDSIKSISYFNHNGKGKGKSTCYPSTKWNHFIDTVPSIYLFYLKWCVISCWLRLKYLLKSWLTIWLQKLLPFTQINTSWNCLERRRVNHPYARTKYNILYTKYYTLLNYETQSQYIKRYK